MDKDRDHEILNVDSQHTYFLMMRLLKIVKKINLSDSV